MNFITNRRQRGFSILDSGAYSSIRECRHNGFDLFAPTPSAAANIDVYTMWTGIVVGIGDPNETNRPRPYNWGAATGSQFNLVIRTGGHYVLYGHLQSVEDFYLGQSVTAGTKIGTLANQADNTHLHVQISIFTSAEAQQQLNSRYGSIKGTASGSPSRVVDFIRFMPASPTNYRGSLISSTTSTAIPCINSTSGAPTAIYNRYDGALLPDTFNPANTIGYNYEVNSNAELKCFNILNSNLPTDSCTPFGPPSPFK